MNKFEFDKFEFNMAGREGQRYDYIFNDIVQQMNNHFNDFMQNLQSRAEEEKYLNELEVIKQYDTETAHGEADQLLIRLLKELGYIKLAVEFDKMDKWYA